MQSLSRSILWLLRIFHPNLMMLSHDAMRIIVKPNIEINRKFLCMLSTTAIASHAKVIGITNPQLLLLAHSKHIRSVV